MSKWKARSIFHFVLPCSDIDESTSFYANFGFEVIKDNRNILWPDWVGTNFNMQLGTQGKAIQLTLPHDDDYQTRIDLIEWIKPKWHNENNGKPLEERIPRIMALLTLNVQEAYKDLVSKGLKPTNPLRPPDELLGVKGVVCFTDPDGHIVELIEYFGDQLASSSENLPTRD
jgi:catechol 2,3-dioxygenase-like lactoylglutathione lyase family enzyme